MFLHLDLDTFFVSAHRIGDTSLLHRPVAVGGRSNLAIFESKQQGIKLYDNNSGAFVNPIFYHDKQNDFERFFIDIDKNGKRKIRGIVVTSSYEARALGVKTGMPLAQALSLAPNMLVLVPNYLLYHKLSFDLNRFLQKQIPKIEQFSIDEFFGDVSGWIEDERVFEWANWLKDEIYKEFSLPISIGISPAKWIAKLATKYAKPHGVYMVRKGEIREFIEDIPIDKFPGIGRGYKRRLDSYRIKTLGDASRAKSLFYSWKKPGIQLYNRIIGEDREGISPKNDRKSIGISRTFDPIYDHDEVLRRILIMARHIIYITLKLGVNPTSYYLRIRYENGLRYRTTKRVDRLFSERVCKEVFKELFEKRTMPVGGITKLSLSVYNFAKEQKRTLSLLDWQEDIVSSKVSKSMQNMREKYSLDIIKTGSEL